MEDFDELDKMLGIAMARQVKDDELSKARSVKLLGQKGSPEWDKANAYVHEWEKRNLWEDAGYEAHISHELCACGHVTETFAGFFHVKKHKRLADRIERSRIRAEDIAHVERGQISWEVFETPIPVCINCFNLKGKDDEEEDGGASPGGSVDVGADACGCEVAPVVGGGTARALWSRDGLYHRPDPRGPGEAEQRVDGAGTGGSGLTFGKRGV